ncbi:MAG: serine hydrolase [Gemmatimonadaceae bacterium]|nr:serine hydrolase [Gemmatimonadaceae bacterium]NUO93643.1 serine hydrolase [Gemmatimonadaceae bacterium]NUP55125.1 serine hydrolase [Gemmatimonadaceae bacterium]NUP71021.1 serine hydrolase [Gemmatimonadaceae bacterium]NUR34962.1 serine hydrolase [Gemmatimonadaceae bacterium]
MSARWKVSTLALLALAPACVTGQGVSTGAAASFARADTTALRRTLDSLASRHHGVVGYAVHDIDTGERLERRGDETFPTASLIKVSVLVTVFDLVERKALSLDDPLTVLKIDKVPGSGQLQFLHDNATITVRDAAWLMTTLSDNTATNLLLDRIIIRRVWDKMEKLGLPHTKVHSKSFLRIASVAMDSSVKYGLGVTTPNEMAQLFALLAAGKAVSPAADSTMLDMLAHNEDFSKLQRFVEGLDVPHKTGDTDQVRTECALFPLQSRVVACVLTKENEDKRYVIDNEAQVMMARMGDAIARAWPRRPPPPATQ